MNLLRSILYRLTTADSDGKWHRGILLAVTSSDTAIFYLIEDHITGRIDFYWSINVELLRED